MRANPLPVTFVIFIAFIMLWHPSIASLGTHRRLYDDDLDHIPPAPPFPPSINNQHHTTPERSADYHPNSIQYPLLIGRGEESIQSDLCETQGSDDEVKVYPLSLTDGEDSFFLQADVKIGKDSPSRFRMSSPNDTITLTSATRLQDIHAVTINGYCRYENEKKQKEYFHCLIQRIDDYQLNSPIHLHYVNYTASQALSATELYLMIHVQLVDYVLLYPLELQLSLTYNFFNSQPISPSVPVAVTRHYFESFRDLFWNTPCLNKTCTESRGITMILDGWAAPTKDDDKESRQRYALKFQLSDNVSFVFEGGGNSTVCKVDYYPINIITLETSPPYRSIMVLLDDITSSEDSTFPVFDLEAISFDCTTLSIHYLHSIPKSYTLTTESGLLERPENYKDIPVWELISRLRWSPKSSYTDQWAFKPYQPGAKISFKPSGYSPDGSTTVRGFVSLAETPKKTDRLLLCGIEEASTVTFSIHQLITNQEKQRVWKSYAPFDHGEVETSRNYPDPFDPTWSIDDLEALLKQYDEDGSGGGKKFQISSNPSTTTTPHGDPSSSPFIVENELTITIPAEPISHHPDNIDNMTKLKFERYLTKRQIFYKEGRYDELGLINPDLVPKVRTEWESKMPVDILSSSQFNPTSQTRPIQFSQDEVKMATHPVYNHGRGGFKTLATPLEDRVCVQLHPFRSLERHEPGIYWFVGAYKLAERGDRFSPTQTSPKTQPEDHIDTTMITQVVTNLDLPSNQTKKFRTTQSSNAYYMDIWFQFIGSHQSVGIGLFNWMFQGNVFLQRGNTLWPNKTIPVYTPSRPRPDPVSSLFSLLSLEAITKSFSSLLSLQYDDADDGKTNKNRNDSNDDNYTLFAENYPYHAPLGPLYIQFSEKDWPHDATGIFSSTIIHSYGYQLLTSSSFLMAHPDKNYFEFPTQFSKFHSLEGCTVLVGEYIESSLEQLKPINGFTVNLIDSLIWFSFNSEALGIYPAAGYDGLYLNCPGLYLISEGHAMFTKKTTIGIHLYETQLNQENLPKPPGINTDVVMETQEFEDQEEGNQDYAFLQYQSHQQSAPQPYQFKPIFPPQGMNSNFGFDDELSYTSQLDPIGLINHEMVKTIPFPTGSPIPDNPLVINPYWTLAYELTSIKDADKAPRPNMVLYMSWFQRNLSQRVLLPFLFAGMGLILLFVILFSVGCTRWRCWKRCKPNGYKEMDDHEQDIAMVNQRQYNNKVHNVMFDDEIAMSPEAQREVEVANLDIQRYNQQLKLDQQFNYDQDPKMAYNKFMGGGGHSYSPPAPVPLSTAATSHRSGGCHNNNTHEVNDINHHHTNNHYNNNNIPHPATNPPQNGNNNKKNDANESNANNNAHNNNNDLPTPSSLSHTSSPNNRGGDLVVRGSSHGIDFTQNIQDHFGSPLQEQQHPGRDTISPTPPASSSSKTSSTVKSFNHSQKLSNHSPSMGPMQTPSGGMPTAALTVHTNYTQHTENSSQNKASSSRQGGNNNNNNNNGVVRNINPNGVGKKVKSNYGDFF